MILVFRINIFEYHFNATAGDTTLDHIMAKGCLFKTLQDYLAIHSLEDRDEEIKGLLKLRDFVKQAISKYKDLIQNAFKKGVIRLEIDITSGTIS